MRRSFRLIAALLTAAILCGGCMNSQEVDDLSFVLTIGVDEAVEPDMYVFTFRVAMPLAFTGEGGGSDKQKTKLVSVKAPAVAEAVRQLAVAMNRQPELSHTSALFIHENVAKKGIYDIVTLFLRNQAYRNTMTVLVTKESAQEVLNKNTAPFELFQYRWVDSLRRIQNLAAIYSINDLRHFYINNANPTKAVLTGYGGTVDKTLENSAAGRSLANQRMPQYDLQTFPREGGTELIVVGSAVFYDWKLVGALNSKESFGANVMKNGVQTVMTITDPLNSDKAVSVAIHSKKPEVDVTLRDRQMAIDVRCTVVCEVTDSAGESDYTQRGNRQKLEDAISEAVRADIMAYFTATQRLGTDCVQVADSYRYKVNTWEQWVRHDWPELYKQAVVNVSVDTTLKRSGLLWRYRNGGESPE